MSRRTSITLLAMWTLAVFVAGAGALAIDDDDASDGATAATVPPVAPADPPADDDSVTGMIEFSGGVAALEVTGSFTQSVLYPITFTSPERGSGSGAEIRGVLVGADLASIAWDAGTPLVVSGDGSLAIVQTPVTLADGVLRADLGGTTAGLAPGTYQLDTPVAVGRSGLAEPRDRVEFVVGATESSTATFRGDVSVELPIVAVDIRGPGGVTLEGSFTHDPGDGTEQPITEVVVGPDDDFVLSLVPFAGGWIVEGQVPAASVVG